MGQIKVSRKMRLLYRIIRAIRWGRRMERRGRHLIDSQPPLHEGQVRSLASQSSASRPVQGTRLVNSFAQRLGQPALVESHHSVRLWMGGCLAAHMAPKLQKRPASPSQRPVRAFITANPAGWLARSRESRSPAHLFPVLASLLYGCPTTSSSWHLVGYLCLPYM